MLRSIPNAASAMLSTLQGHASQLGAIRQEESCPRGASIMCLRHTWRGQEGDHAGRALCASRRGGAGVSWPQHYPRPLHRCNSPLVGGLSYLSLVSLVSLTSLTSLTSGVSGVS